MREPGILALLACLALLAIALVRWQPRWSKALNTLSRMTTRGKQTASVLALLLLVSLVLVTDWPWQISDAWHEFWADRALLSGTVTTVLLLGAGWFFYDAEREALQVEHRQRIRATVASSIDPSFKRVRHCGIQLANASTRSTSSQSRALVALASASAEYIAELRHWQGIALGLNDGEWSLLIERIGWELALLREIQAETLALADTTPDPMTYLGPLLSDLGGTHELLCFELAIEPDIERIREFLRGRSEREAFGANAPAFPEVGGLCDRHLLARFGTCRSFIAYDGSGRDPGPDHQSLRERGGSWDPEAHLLGEAWQELRRIRSVLAERATGCVHFRDQETCDHIRSTALHVAAPRP